MSFSADQDKKLLFCVLKNHTKNKIEAIIDLKNIKKYNNIEILGYIAVDILTD